jgi:uncharacterized protein (DUF2147 family)
MKLIYCSLALFILSSFAFAQANDADKILGIYWSPKKDAKIEIFKRSGKYYGKFIWSSTPRKDTKNPKASLRSRALVGIEFLTSFSYQDDSYTNGEIYDPESGKTYNCKMTLHGKDIKARGYVGLSMFGRTEIFERVL